MRDEQQMFCFFLDYDEGFSFLKGFIERNKQTKTERGKQKQRKRRRRGRKQCEEESDHEI
jgi:hypothetical protein